MDIERRSMRWVAHDHEMPFSWLAEVTSHGTRVPVNPLRRMTPPSSHDP